jgi:shikimate kinase
LSDYYDPHPRLTLERPVLLAGQIGCGSAAMARNVCGRTGLSFVELDRELEHRAGRSLARLATEWGRDRLAREASLALLELAAKRPAGLIVLANAWPAIPEGYLERLRERVHLVHIDRPRSFLVPRLEQEVARAGDWIVASWPGWPSAAETPEEQTRQSADFFSEREPLLLSAHSMLDAGTQHANAIAEILLESLEGVFQADPI